MNLNYVVAPYMGICIELHKNQVFLLIFIDSFINNVQFLGVREGGLTLCETSI